MQLVPQVIRKRENSLLQIFGFAFLMVFAYVGIAGAAPPEIVEEDIPPPAAKQAKPVKKPAPKPAEESQELVSPPAPAVKTAPAEKNVEKPAAEPGERTQGPKRDETASVTTDNGDLTYTIRTGDTPDEIADTFHVDTAELLSLNRLSTDSILHKGMTLRIPNPAAAQVRALKNEVQKLNEQVARSRTTVDSASGDLQVLHAQVEELTNENQGLKYDVRVLPWWRAMALTSVLAVAVVALIFAVALFDWFMLRRRFRALVEMNDALRRLDNKYKAVLAKAELRFQQLYGRRRLGVADGQDVGRTSEAMEIERLNQELKQTLEAELERLAPSRQNGHRRSRLRDLFTTVSAPPAERPERR